MQKNKAAQELGRKGGSVKSQKKAEAARKNAKKPRCKWVSAFAYGVIGADGKQHVGLVVERGRKGMDFLNKSDMEWITAMVNRDLAWDTKALPFKEFVNFSGRTMCV